MACDSDQRPPDCPIILWKFGHRRFRTPLKLSIVDQSPVPAGFNPADALRNTIELARLADRLGYHRYWIAEHHAIPALSISAPEILIDRIYA